MIAWWIALMNLNGLNRDCDAELRDRKNACIEQPPYTTPHPFYSLSHLHLFLFLTPSSPPLRRPSLHLCRNPMQVIHQRAPIAPIIVHLRQAPVAVGQLAEHGEIDVVVDVLERVGVVEGEDVGPGVGFEAVGHEDVFASVRAAVSELLDF